MLIQYVLTGLVLHVGPMDQLDWRLCESLQQWVFGARLSSWIVLVLIN